MRFNVHWFDQAGSTNRSMLEALVANPELPTGTVFAAREQTEGRGRDDRRWQSVPGRDLTFSLLWRCAVKPRRVPALGMAAAVGVAHALEESALLATLKWPNDVLVDGRKIAGLLCETRLEGNRVVAIIGIGLNVNMDAKSASEIDRPATSIFLETGTQRKVDDILALLLQVMPDWLYRWEAQGFEGLREAWEARSPGLGKPVRVGHGGFLREGVLKGFGPYGELLLEVGDSVESVTFGEIPFALE